MRTKLTPRNIFEAFIIILIISDIVLLILITFSDLNPTVVTNIIYFDLIVCVILFFDFIYRMSLENDKKAFIRDNWLDIIAMIPIDFFMFRFLRFARLFKLLRLVALFRREWKYISSFFKQTHINVAFGMLLFTLFAGTIIFYLLEHGTNPEIKTIWDSMWFTLTTIISGNSFVAPDTYYGEWMAVFLMIIGISFVGILTASLASWFMSKSKRIQEDKEENNEKKLEHIENSLEELKNDIDILKELLKNNK